MFSRHLVKMLTCALFALFLAGAPANAANEAGGSEYLIGPEDVLEIVVWRNTELSRQVTVRPDGRITLPLIGELPAAGLTPEKLRAEIVERLKEYQQSAVVASVIVQSVNSYRVYVLGQVQVPGSYTLKSRTTVLQALSLAGGFSQFASKNKIVLIRKRADGLDDKIQVKFNDLVYDEESRANEYLLPGDTIFVP
ncbi:MAG: polysaccharide biosynthesis/export family protein [Deltaproteobacteria bacterium]|nr:polysaccharide biosynthesis/export family protein [Deltaproteobacteria bacterium]MCL4874131.1 polysaccharide biosynthesis/export family protein [bacterium]